MDITKNDSDSLLLGKFPHCVKGNSANDKNGDLGFIPQMEINRENQLAIISEGLKRKGITRHALEKLSGVPVGTIKDLQRGKRAMMADKWQKITRVLSDEEKGPSLSKEENLRDSEIAIIGALHSILTMITDNNPAMKSSLREMLSDQQNGYHIMRRPNAEEVPRLLLDALEDKKHGLHPHTLLQMLKRAPSGSA
jgi:hypothetical protein